MPKVMFLPLNAEVAVAPGTILLDAALDHNIRINHNCGGNCGCASCHVHIVQGLESLKPVTEDELDMLQEAEDLRANSRLACQCRVTTDMVVDIPPGERDLDEVL